MSERLFYQASGLVSALIHLRISALSACDWERADRIDRIVERARDRKWRRWPALWPDRSRSEYGS